MVQCVFDKQWLKKNNSVITWRKKTKYDAEYKIKALKKFMMKCIFKGFHQIGLLG